MFTVQILGGIGQAQGLPLLDTLETVKTLGEAREGRHKACPYLILLGIATSLGQAREGRHKACHYWNACGDCEDFGCGA